MIVTEKRKSIFEWSSLCATTGIGIAAVWVGAAQFASSYSQSVRTPYLEKRLEFCVDLSELSGQLAVEDQNDDYLELRKEWMAVFWGASSVFTELDPLDEALIDFRKQLLVADSVERRGDLLEGAALNLGRTCKEIITTDWN